MATNTTTPTKATRPRVRSGSAPTKAAATKAAQVAATAPDVTAEATAVEAPTSTRTVVALEHVGSTKSFEKFQAPADSGCAGNFYAPLGTTEVKVAFIGS